MSRPTITHYRKAGRVTICGRQLPYSRKWVARAGYDRLQDEFGCVSCKLCVRMIHNAGMKALGHTPPRYSRG